MVKFYDILNIEWHADELNSKSMTYYNRKRPYQIHDGILLDSSNMIKIDSNILEYPFEFRIPERLIGSIDVPHAQSRYFIKCYLSSDDSITSHYSPSENIFNDFFRSLNQFYMKKEVFIRNKLIALPMLAANEAIFEARSAALRVTVVLPKTEFSRNETFEVSVVVENLMPNAFNEMYKISFKVLQTVKLISMIPLVKSKLFENLIVHYSLKNVKKNIDSGFHLIQKITIPSDAPSTSIRSDAIIEKPDMDHLNPIRINYKLSIEFWKSFYNEELDINIPIRIDPEV